MASTTSAAFFGATGGCGLSALRHALRSGQQCVALARTPAKLEALLPPPANPTLSIKQGNAHDVQAVASCLVSPSDPSVFVDRILFSIGGAFNFSKMTLDDPHVCDKGMTTLLAALASLREQGIAGRPRIVVVSTNGISDHGRDYPVLLLPVYKVMLKVPHVDKRAMEASIMASSEDWIVVRPSLLTDGETEKKIRVGVEDPAKGLEKKEVGYSISREDVGRWIFENCMAAGEGDQYKGKIVSITW